MYTKTRHVSTGDRAQQLRALLVLSEFTPSTTSSGSQLPITPAPEAPDPYDDLYRLLNAIPRYTQT